MTWCLCAFVFFIADKYTEPKMNLIKISSIKSDDTTYRITTDTSIDNLTRSIKETGLLHPPILIQKESLNNEFIIISGFRRIESCQYLGWSEIEARILPHDTEKIEQVKIAISDNSFQRPLNLIEVSRSLNLLSEFFKDNKELAEAAAKLGLPGHPGVIRKMEKLSNMPIPVQNTILSDTISLAMACEMDTFENDTAITLVKLFDDLKLSLNKQREIITLVKEIAIREDISMQDVLGGDALQQILNNSEPDRNQKSQKIRFYLKERRFPAITKNEKSFDALVKSLNLGNNVKLIPPRDFEGTEYNLNLSFSSLTELKSHKSLFDRLIQNSVIEKIFE